MPLFSIGAYDDAFKYALRVKSKNKTSNDVSVIKFKLKSQTNIINLNDVYWNRKLNLFIRKFGPRIVEEYGQTFRNNSIGHANKMDGKIIDSFINFIEKRKLTECVECVIKNSKNDFGTFNIRMTTIENSVELCIKKPNVIDKGSMKIVKGGMYNG